MNFTLNFQHAIILHPQDVKNAFKSEIRKWHPDKCRSEDKRQVHMERTRLLYAARKLLLVEVDDTGMPIPGEQYTARFNKAKKVYNMPGAKLAETMTTGFIATSTAMCVCYLVLSNFKQH